MIYDELLQTIVRGIPKQQLEMLEHFHLIDLGVIKGYNIDGTANIQALYLEQGSEITYDHVEVLYIGTNAGAITCNAEGALCLLLKPMVCIPDTNSMEIAITESSFSNVGMKAIPITRGDNTLLKTGFNGDGVFSIEGDGVRIQVSNKNVLISNGKDCISIGASEGVAKTLCNGNLSVIYGTTVQKVLYDNDGNELLSETIDADGQVTITKGTVSISITDDEDDKQVVTVSNNNTSFSIDKDGNLTISCAGKLKLTGKGVEIDSGSNDQVVIKGKGLDAINSHLEVS